MSTHPHSEHDLDRTDELPRLDVAAYEAQLAAEANDTLSSTDAWAVDELRDAMEARSREVTALRFPRPRAQPPEPPKSSDVTLDANRILGRIQQLESELAASKQREAELEARFDRLGVELAAKEKEARGLGADNARLAEQRSIVIERVRSLEQQLKDETAQLEREIELQRELRLAEQGAATSARMALEQQVSDLTALAAQLREDNSRLDDEAQAATKLVKTQSELIEQFKQRLAAEEKNSAQLARHLAAKIAEHAGADHEIARRDATIRALTNARDDLAALLEEARTEGKAQQTQLEERERMLAERDASIRERDDAATARDARIAQLETDLAAANGTISLLTADREGLQQTLITERESQAQAQQALSARAQEIDQLQGSTEALQARIASLEEQLASEQSAQRYRLAKIETLERTLAESQLSGDALSDELAAVRRELDEVRANLVTKHSELTVRDEALRSAQDILAQLRKSNGDLEHHLQDARARVEALEAREREREESVVANAADLAAARRQLGQQLAAVQSMEQAIRARDTLTERLRAELQMSQDERAIMAGQLEKSRARNKSMAREIFARDSQIAALKADLAVHAETLAAIRQDVNRTVATADEDHPERILEPVGHDADIIVLDKKMMTIGRTSDNDICIPSKLVSRNHARLLIGPNAVIIEDAGSTNGCLVNDVQVKQQLMREGDVLSIGDLKFRLRTRSDAATRARDNVIPFP
jgi:chromosome segregation ATPase